MVATRRCCMMLHRTQVPLALFLMSPAEVPTRRPVARVWPFTSQLLTTASHSSSPWELGTLTFIPGHKRLFIPPIPTRASLPIGSSGLAQWLAFRGQAFEGQPKKRPLGGGAMTGS